MMQGFRFTATSFSLLLLASLLSSGNSSNTWSNYSKAASTSKAQTNGKIVYVCACLKTKSCSCMTESKMEGPCACGTQGGPPLKPVPADSDWAKQNRDALAK
jgi:hypothetical protein